MSTLTGIEVWEKIKIPSLQIKPTNNMWIFNNQAASMHAALVHRWHLHIIEDLIDDDDQERFICLFDLGFRVCSVQSGYSTTGLHLCMPP